jgi:hypothetical protein
MAETKENNNNQTAEPERLGWRDRLKKRNPELNLDDDMAVGDYLGSEFDKYDEGEKQRNAFNDMLAKDERSAGILTGLATGLDQNGEPFSLAGYLVENYGDILRDSANDEEAVKKAKEREAEMIKKAAETEKRQKQLQENLEKSDEALTEAVKETNSDEATTKAMLDWLYAEETGLIFRMLQDKLEKEDWVKLLYAFNRDNALNGAREEGRKAGVNTRPGAAHRRLANDVPTDLGGGGANYEGGAGEEENPTLSTYSAMKRRF